MPRRAYPARGGGNPNVSLGGRVQHRAKSSYKLNFNTKTYQEGVININLGPDPEVRKSIFGEQLEHALGVDLVQIYNLKQGLNKFRTEGKKSASKEITQHRDLHTFHTIDHKTLTREEKQQALRSLIFLTKKGYRRVKPRMCADSSKQRRRLGYKKENYALSTCHTEPIFLTSVTGAKDGRKFATIDVPGIYLCASAAEEVIMPLEGRLAKLIVPVDPKLYQEYITVGEDEIPCLSVLITKALYGLLESALQWYTNFVWHWKQVALQPTHTILVSQRRSSTESA